MSRVEEAGRSTAPPLFKSGTIWALLALALALRTWMALTTSLIVDESRDWVVAAQAISFAPDHVNLPLRTESHGALVAYLIKLGSFIFGPSVIGFRFFSILAGVATVAVVSAAVYEWKGRNAALWAALLLGFNEFHVFVSFVATQLVFSIFFMACATYAFMRALRSGDARWLYPTALAAGFGYLCYEVFVLALPAFTIAVLLSNRRAWLRGVHIYLAAGLGVSLAAVDLAAGLMEAGGGNYDRHFSRFGGLGFTKYYLQFFFRDAASYVYQLSGRWMYDNAPEYLSMNSLFGIVICTSVLYFSYEFLKSIRREADRQLLFLLSAFGFLFGTFLFVRPGVSLPGSPLDPQGWYWAALSLVPGSFLAAALMVRLTERSSLAAGIVGAAAISLALVTVSHVDQRIPKYGLVMLPDSQPGHEPQWKNVRLFVGPCELCDPRPEMVLLDIRRVGENASAIKAGEIHDAEPGTVDLTFSYNALNNPDDDYIAIYLVGEPSGRQHLARYVIEQDDAPSIFASFPQPDTVPGGRPARPVASRVSSGAGIR